MSRTAGSNTKPNHMLASTQDVTAEVGVGFSYVGESAISQLLKRNMSAASVDTVDSEELWNSTKERSCVAFKRLGAHHTALGKAIHLIALQENLGVKHKNYMFPQVGLGYSIDELISCELDKVVDTQHTYIREFPKQNFEASVYLGNNQDVNCEKREFSGEKIDHLAALAEEESYTMPRGLTREQRQEWARKNVKIK